MKLYRVNYSWPTFDYPNGFSYKWARDAKTAEKMVKKILSGNKGPIKVTGVEETNG